MGKGWTGRFGGGKYAVIDDILVSGIVVDVDCDAAEGGDFGGELVEAGVVLPGEGGVLARELGDDVWGEDTFLARKLRTWWVLGTETSLDCRFN